MAATIAFAALRASFLCPSPPARLAGTRVHAIERTMPAERAAGIFSEAMGELDRLIVAVGSNRDRGAFADLYRHFAPRVKSYLLRLGADSSPREGVQP